jgi:hypothetical protein
MVQAIPSFLFPLQIVKPAETPIFIICPTELTVNTHREPFPLQEHYHQQMNQLSASICLKKEREL